MKVVRIHTDEGQFTAVIGKPGRIYTPFVTVDFPVRMQRMANGDVAKFTTPLKLGEKDYPLRRAANHMLRVGRKHGISKRARNLLLEAKA